VALDNDSTVSVLKCTIIKPEPKQEVSEPADIEQDERIPIGSAQSVKNRAGLDFDDSSAARRPGKFATENRRKPGASHQVSSAAMNIRHEEDVDMEPVNGEEGRTG
jgi:hypothetical protein